MAEECKHCGTNLPADLPVIAELADGTKYVRCPNCERPYEIPAKQAKKVEPKPALVEEKAPEATVEGTPPPET